MSSYVIDASVLLACIRKEPGYELPFQHIRDWVISTVNLSEALGVMVSRYGYAYDRARQYLEELDIETMSFDTAMAYKTAKLKPLTRHKGLSFGDCACLALAIAEDLPVFTADRAWKNLNLPVSITLIR